MRIPLPRITRLRWGILACILPAVAALEGCGSSSAVEPNPGIAPLVGFWEATSMVITNVANPSVAPDLITLGAKFTFDVEPSGQYTAILVFAGQSSTEIGMLTLNGDVLTLQRQHPSPQVSTSRITLDGDHLTMDGPTEFDFNLDGTPEAATAHIELVRK